MKIERLNPYTVFKITLDKEQMQKIIGVRKLIDTTIERVLEDIIEDGFEKLEDKF